MEVGPGDPVADHELPAPLLHPPLQLAELGGEDLLFELLLLLRLLGGVPLEEDLHVEDLHDVVDAVDHLVHLAPLQVAVAGNLELVGQEPGAEPVMKSF